MRRFAIFVAALLLASAAGAALDSKQKRGSVISLSVPGRVWLSEPDGSDLAADTERMCVMTFAAAVSPAAPGGVLIPLLLRHYEQLRHANSQQGGAN